MGEMIKYGLKIAVAVMAAGAFFVALSLILSMISTVVLGGVIGEVLALIGVFMPWNASALLAVGTALQAGVSFMVAHKIYSLLSYYNKQTS